MLIHVCDELWVMRYVWCVIRMTRKCSYRLFISCVMSDEMCDEFWVISPTSP